MLLSQRGTESYSVTSVSLAGAKLAGAFRIDPGERVKLFFHIEGERSLGVTAEVICADSKCAALRFCDLDTEAHHRIGELVTTAIERQWFAAEPGILVVDDAAAVVASVTRDVAELAWTVVHATTSNEVIRLLGDRSVCYQAALVNIALSRVNTGALLRHLADLQPAAKRIVIAGPGRAVEADDEVSSGRAHAWISRPWQGSELRALI